MEVRHEMEAARARLVAEVRRKGIRDERVLAALARVPRERFMAESDASLVYADEAQPIALGQTISQPFTVAYQTEWLKVTPGLRVLEVGTGSGYQAAILAELRSELFSIERHRALHEHARTVLEELGYQVQLRLGDGTQGWPEVAPFDRILVTAAGSAVPPPLLEQLRLPRTPGEPGGRLVMPIGGPTGQVMTRYTRRGPDTFEREEGELFRFVPLVSG